MRKLTLVLILMACFCSPTRAQDDPPRFAVFGGYSYLNVDTNGLTSRQSANGWEASLSGNLNRWFAVEGGVSGYYKTYPLDLSLLGLSTISVAVHDYSYLAGPRINYRPVFVHALIGGDHLTGSALGFSASQDSFAAAFGGGLQWQVKPRWAVRASGDYILTHHNFLGIQGVTYTQNNFRASVGIVYTFGRRGERSPRPERTSTPRSANPKYSSPGCEDSSEAALLGVVGCSVENGLKVTTVRSGSPAIQAGISPGDIITEIDGRPVHSSHDIEAAIAGSASGTVKVSYMIRGAWLTEREAKIR